MSKNIVIYQSQFGSTDEYYPNRIRLGIEKLIDGINNHTVDVLSIFGISESVDPSIYDCDIAVKYSKELNQTTIWENPLYCTKTGELYDESSVRIVTLTANEIEQEIVSFYNP